MVFLAFAAAAAFVTLRRAAVFCFAVDMYSPRSELIDIFSKDSQLRYWTFTHNNVGVG